MIRIILADDYNIIRFGLKSLLEKEADIEIAGEASGLEELQLFFERGNTADIIFIDKKMLDSWGMGFTKVLPPIKLVLFTTHQDENNIFEAFKAGISGYLLKNTNPQEILFAIRNVYQGKHYISLDLTKHLLEQSINLMGIDAGTSLNFNFSKREMEVLKLIADGYTNQEIANRLFTSKRTVEGHRQALIDKTGVPNAAALVKVAVTNRIIS